MNGKVQILLCVHIIIYVFLELNMYKKKENVSLSLIKHQQHICNTIIHNR